jgi:ribosome-binding protein aMBF1 (putative translation factor)
VGAGIKVSDLKKIEIGKNMVPFSQLTKLEKFLEFKISDFTKTLPKEKE